MKAWDWASRPRSASAATRSTGSSFLDHLALFEEDPDTEAVLMIGEIGGPQEAEAAAWIQKNMSKPSSASSPASRRPRAARWGMPVRSSRRPGDSAGEKAEIMRSLTASPSPRAQAPSGPTMAQVMSGHRKAA